MAEFGFEQGELAIADSRLAMQIRGWPEPQAQLSRGSVGWQEFRPEFRLVRPEALIEVPEDAR